MKILLSLFFLILFTTSLQANEIKILSNTPGDGIEIKNHFKVTVNYRGILDTGVVFDSSFKRNEPFIFQIGLKQVIPGWEKGLLGMKVGGKRTIKIPPRLAYGSKGAGDLIPPNATLIFEIEIINAVPPSYKNILTNELFQKRKDNIIIIDVRTKKETELTGVINGSIKIIAFDIKGNFNPNFIKSFKSVATMDEHVVFVSNEGEISSILANGFMEQLGAKHMYSLEGGIQKWIKEKREVIK